MTSSSTASSITITSSDDGVRVEGEHFKSYSPRISHEEHEEAAQMHAETGCVPLAYHDKVASGFFRFKGLPW